MMKITKEQLKQIIQEELEVQQSLNETQDPAKQLKQRQDKLCFLP